MCYSVEVAADLPRRVVVVPLLALVCACGGGGDDAARDATPGPENDARVADADVAPDAMPPADAARPEPADGAPVDAGTPPPVEDAAPPADVAVEADSDPADAGPPAAVRVCSNGIDDDADGRTDFPADPQCATAEGGAEASVCEAAVSFFALGPSGGRFEVDLGSGVGRLESPVCGPGFGRERVFAMDVDRAGRLSARLQALGGGVQLSLRTDCDAADSETACDAPVFGAATVEADLVAPGRVFLVAESNAFEPAIDATLEVNLGPPRGDVPPPFVDCPAAPGALTVPP